MVLEFEPLLPGVGFAGYRSFAAWEQILLPTKVTVLAGINNSGKSNVLRFLHDVLPTVTQRSGSERPQWAKPRLSYLDKPQGFEKSADFEVGFPVLIDDPGNDFDARKVAKQALTKGNAGALRMALMQILSPNERVFWARQAPGGNGKLVPSRQQVADGMERWPAWNSNFESALRALGGGSVDPRSVMTQLLASIPVPVLPPVTTIASSRRIEPTDDESASPDWSSGRGIINELFKLQNPTHTDWDDSKARWRAINEFLENVLGDPNVSLTVPHDQSTIQVATKDRVLPLKSLGSGVEQVVILAAAATVVSKHLVCVEEPETNLHPLLQKKLLRYLTEQTDNQYVIATHSSHFLDDSRATAYNVQLTESGTKLSVARRPHELVQICNDLGYRPSDLQQANCVIWVEGPSDRTYIRRWLELVDPKLTEGIDYSVMFYGGSLLSHLSASDVALDAFISLRRLNRFSTILIDSDRTGPQKRVNKTKQRVQKEYLDDAPAPGSAWITAGYTVENYIPQEILRKAVLEVHPRASFVPATRWKNPFPQGQADSVVNKVAVAQVAAQLLEPSHLEVFDLKDRVETLRAFIRTSNGHSTAPDSVA